LIKTELKPINFNDEIKKLTENFIGREGWLFKEINHWLLQHDQRFFILIGEPGVGKSAIAAHLIQTRTDIVAAHHFCQLGVEETVDAGRVLRSLAAQLDLAFPDYYGEALFNTINSTQSGEVDIKIKSIDDLEGKIKSKVQRFKINHLKPSDIVNEFDILLRAPLAALPQIYEKNGQKPPELAIIVIDALDVAVTMEKGVQEEEDLATLFGSLAEDESLPSWVRFLFTTRPDRRVLREFEPLKPYLINKRLVENLADIRQYVNHRMANSPVLQQQVTVTPMESQAWLEQLTERSKGNFRFIKSLLDDLEAESCSFGDLSVLPLEVKKLYEKDFTQRFPEEEWGDRHYQILKTLAEAENPLSENELGERLSEIRPQQLRQDLWGLRQYLDVEVIDKGDEQHETFSIFHNSLQAYLNERSLVTAYS
jgi:hypothetical protein